MCSRIHARPWFLILSGFSSVFLFVSIFLSVFHLSGFSSVFYFLFNFDCDFPQCFYFFCLEFFILPARGFEPARSWISGELLNHCASSVPRPITAVFPLVVKRRSCLPQLDPLKHGRSFAVSWPYFLVLFVYRYIFSMDFFLIGRVHEVLYSYINLVSCLVLYMYSCTGTSWSCTGSVDL